jgi:DNA modification methylase
MQVFASAQGFPTISEYLRSIHRDAFAARSDRKAPRARHYGPLNKVHSTKLGQILEGDSLEYLHHKAKPGSVNLIMTSPPFGLVKRKSYGNEDADAYCDWFRPFAEGFRRVLAEDGSLVIDIGGAWKQGRPTRSLYHFKLLLMLCEEYGFHLAQEHYWWNPAKLPSPAEWVNVRRIRVKDAVNCVWWLSKDPFPKASNRRVLTPYSASMEKLLVKGYSAKMRPSGHDITAKFSRNNGGAVPPNLLAIANTESTSYYQEYCRRNDIPIHPARFPAQLPDYFIRMLTDPGDLVIDPFGGSAVTGMVAEQLGRRWASIEMDSDYNLGAVARFHVGTPQTRKSRPAVYTIAAPVRPEPSDQEPAPLGRGLPLTGARSAAPDDTRLIVLPNSLDGTDTSDAPMVEGQSDRLQATGT